MQLEPDQVQVGQGNHTAKEVTAELGISSVPGGPEVPELSGLALPKGVLHLIAIQAGLDYLIHGPVYVRGHDNILAESGHMLSDAVVVLSEIHLEAIFFSSPNTRS